MINFWEVAARKKLRVGDDWQMYRWERVNDRKDSDVIVTGAVPIGAYTRGPRKGSPKWNTKLGERVTVSDRDFAESQREYEAATGNCRNCYGTGQQWCGWSADTGAKHRPCARCNETGRATQPLPPQSEEV